MIDRLVDVCRQVEGFPNMFMVMGPHTALGNIPHSIEYNVDWVTGVIRHMRDNDLTRGECTPAGVKDWTNHMRSLGEGLLSNEVDSWMTGINRNVEGKTERIVARCSPAVTDVNSPALQPARAKPCAVTPEAFRPARAATPRDGGRQGLRENPRPTFRTTPPGTLAGSPPIAQRKSSARSPRADRAWAPLVEVAALNEDR